MMDLQLLTLHKKLWRFILSYSHRLSCRQIAVLVPSVSVLSFFYLLAPYWLAWGGLWCKVNMGVLAWRKGRRIQWKALCWLYILHIHVFGTRFDFLVWWWQQTKECQKNEYSKVDTQYCRGHDWRASWPKTKLLRQQTKCVDTHWV